jgi:hypothetical protein
MNLARLIVSLLVAETPERIGFVELTLLLLLHSLFLLHHARGIRRPILDILLDWLLAWLLLQACVRTASRKGLLEGGLGRRDNRLRLWLRLVAEVIRC